MYDNYIFNYNLYSQFEKKMHKSLTLKAQHHDSSLWEPSQMYSVLFIHPFVHPR